MQEVNSLCTDSRALRAEYCIVSIPRNKYSHLVLCICMGTRVSLLITIAFSSTIVGCWRLAVLTRPDWVCNLAPSTPATMSKQHCRILQVERFFRQNRMLLRHCCRFWQQCRTKFRPVDKLETNWTCPICFDFVERTKFYDKLLRQ